MATTDNRDYPEIPATSAPDVPYWVNLLARAIDVDVEAVAGSIAGGLAALGPAWATLRSVPADADLNTFRTPGIWRIRTPDTATIVNLPPGMRTAGLLENTTTGDGTDTIFAQKVTEQGDGARIMWRSALDTVLGTLTPWARHREDSTPVTEWHVFLAAGQSNMSGRGIVGEQNGGKYYSHRIAQFGYTRRVLETATVPLDMHDTATGLSPATVFARNYLRGQPEHVGVLIVPAAHGGTAFTSSTSTYTWTPNVATNPAYNLPASAVTQTLDAMAAATAAGKLVSLKGILWHQGESNGSLSTASYATALDGLISYFRTQLAAPTLPFVVGQMVPEGIAANTGRPGIDTAHQQTPGRVQYTAFAPSTANGYNPGDTTHMSKPGVDFIGRTYLEAYGRALGNVSPFKWSHSAGRTAYAVNALTGLDQLIYGDTGWRDISSSFATLTAGKLYIRRSMNTVTIEFEGAIFSDGAGTVTFSGVLPLGFRTLRNSVVPVLVTGSATVRRTLTTPGGSLQIYATSAGESYTGVIHGSTADVWPTTLPGVAVGALP